MDQTPVLNQGRQEKWALCNRNNFKFQQVRFESSLFPSSMLILIWLLEQQLPLKWPFSLSGQDCAVNTTFDWITPVSPSWQICCSMSDIIIHRDFFFFFQTSWIIQVSFSLPGYLEDGSQISFRHSITTGEPISLVAYLQNWFFELKPAPAARPLPCR